MRVAAAVLRVVVAPHGEAADGALLRTRRLAVALEALAARHPEDPTASRWSAWRPVGRREAGHGPAAPSPAGRPGAVPGPVRCASSARFTSAPTSSAMFMSHAQTRKTTAVASVP